MAAQSAGSTIQVATLIEKRCHPSTVVHFPASLQTADQEGSPLLPRWSANDVLSIEPSGAISIVLGKLISGNTKVQLSFGGTIFASGSKGSAILGGNAALRRDPKFAHTCTAKSMALDAAYDSCGWFLGAAFGGGNVFYPAVLCCRR